MRKLALTLGLALSSVLLNAQINYTAQIGQVNTQVQVQTRILDGSVSGSSVRSEQFSVTTDSLGVFTIHIGEGSGVSGVDLDLINWETPKFLELSINGNVQGTTQIMQVPMAIHSKTASSAKVADSSSVTNFAHHSSTSDNSTNSVNSNHSVVSDSSSVANHAHVANTANNINIITDNSLASAVMGDFGNGPNTGITITLNTQEPVLMGVVMIKDVNGNVSQNGFSSTAMTGSPIGTEIQSATLLLLLPSGFYKVQLH